MIRTIVKPVTEFLVIALNCIVVGRLLVAYLAISAQKGETIIVDTRYENGQIAIWHDARVGKGQNGQVSVDAWRDLEAGVKSHGLEERHLNEYTQPREKD